MKLTNLLFFIVFVIDTYPQMEVFRLEPFSVSIVGNIIQVHKEDKLIEEKLFSNPSAYSVDLDGDSLNDFFIIDKQGDSSKANYVIYFFNALDSFYLADSLFSGFFEPYITLAEESDETIIVSGDSRFLGLDTLNSLALPVNCYRFESGELLLINDEQYSIFIQENEDILDNLEQYFNDNPRNCNTSKVVISAVSAAYANYISAGEPTLAHQLISKYYYCEDSEMFIKKMNELINN